MNTTGCAIVGIGETAYVRGSGSSTLRLAAQCSLRAIQDAGLVPADIDGIILYWMFEPLDGIDVAVSLAYKSLPGSSMSPAAATTAPV